MPLRILFISSCPPYPLYLGDRLIVGNLVRELNKLGHSIDFIGHASKEEDFNQTEHYAAYLDDIELYRIPAHDRNFRFKRLLQPATRFPKTHQEAWAKDMWGGIEKKLAENQYDFVHVFGAKYVHEFYHLIQHLPHVIVPYESRSLWMRRYIEKHGGSLDVYKNLFWSRQFEKWMFEPYARTVVLAEPDQDELIKLNPKIKLSVIPNGIDPETFSPCENVEREPAAFVFIGNYQYGPNEDAANKLIYDMFPKIQQQIPDAKLILVGNQPTEKMLENTNPQIEITGRVPDVVDYLCKGTIYLCPLTFGAGLKNKVLEALASGIPMVATPLSVDGITGEHQKHFIVSDVDNFVEATVQLYKDKPLQQTISVNGRELVISQYSWKSVAERYTELYQEIKSQFEQAISS